MIYKAGHKYIDLERVTAIEAIIHTTNWTRDDKGALQAIPLDPPETSGAYIHCQLHEKSIEVYFQWRNHPSELANPNQTPQQQFDDLMAAWRAVVEKRNTTPAVQNCPPPTEAEMDNARRSIAGYPGCPICHTFHNSNEACPGF
jgi:hypothetical protein